MISGKRCYTKQLHFAIAQFRRETQKSLGVDPSLGEASKIMDVLDRLIQTFLA